MKRLIAIILFKLGFRFKIGWSLKRRLDRKLLSYGYGHLRDDDSFNYEIPPKYVKI